MGSTADQYHDRPAGLLLWFVVSAKQIYCCRARNCKCKCKCNVSVSVSVMLAYSQSLNA